MKHALPMELDPFREAEKGQHFEGVFTRAQMQRLMGMHLCDTAQETDDKITVILDFGISIEGYKSVQCDIVASLTRKCQRCLECFVEKTQLQSHIAFVRSEREVDEIPENLEPYVVADNLMRLSEFVEDELILALPVIPMHEEMCV
ncbi:MAG: DUF177 domain-containing protein, partial [Gammaproteobacteria bacterium]|nr:DUF177 domain-containing protein [Gammaproteobacteria bacterium]